MQERIKAFVIDVHKGFIFDQESAGFTDYQELTDFLPGPVDTLITDYLTTDYQLNSR